MYEVSFFYNVDLFIFLTENGLYIYMLLFKKEQKKEKLGWCLFVQVMPIKTSVYQELYLQHFQHRRLNILV